MSLQGSARKWAGVKLDCSGGEGAGLVEMRCVEWDGGEGEDGGEGGEVK